MKLSARLAKLESSIRPAGGLVVTYALGEAPEDALSRARAAGVTGGVLLVGEVLPPKIWEPLAREQQSTQRCEVVTMPNMVFV